jgi:hypothetical protein
MSLRGNVDETVTDEWAVTRSNQTQARCHAERSEASAVAFFQTSGLAVIRSDDDHHPIL